MSGWLGLLRSLFLYWRPGRQRGLQRLYAPLVGRGDLVFDIGAHVGDRTAAFAALGARVVAVEPQPRFAKWLRRLLARNERVTVIEAAVGASPGTVRLAISRRTPTVSTVSSRWRVRVARDDPSFRAVRWDEEIDVEMVTLDQLVELHGLPRFCKIDVEGSEPDVLAGLSHAIPALSLEFVSGDLGGAEECLQRLCEIGPYMFNVVLGERRTFVFPDWQPAERLQEWLASGAGGATSGDIYARLETEDRP